MEKPVFTGVCTALVTPFHRGTVDFEKLEQLLDFQIANGVQAVAVCGTTGEVATMSEQEQLGVIAHSVQYCKGRMKVIAGTGSNNTAHAVSLSAMADSIGADGILVVTPYYNKATGQGLIAHFTAIADAVRCPVIVYNVPSRTGVDISVEVCKEISKHDRIAGIKEASGSVTKVARILSSCSSDFSVWSGNDDEIVPLMSLGAKGVISVLSNICPAQTVAMVNACLAGDYGTAGKLQCGYMELIDALFCEVNPTPIKHALNMAGFDVGDTRLPLCRLSQPAEERLRRALVSHRIIPT